MTSGALTYILIQAPLTLLYKHYKLLRIFNSHYSIHIIQLTLFEGLISYIVYQRAMEML